MFVVGLTGGISSGKSTIAALFAEKGVPVIDADEIARKITQPDEPAFNKIVELFSLDLLLPDGQLDRARLRQIVFADEVKRKKLEQLLHPLIRAEMKSQIEALDAPYCIAMIPLLLETAPNPLVKRILIIDTPEDLQISRTTLRDKIPCENVQAILTAQISRSKRLKLADDIIINQGTFEDLIPQVNQLHKLYLALAKQSS